MKLHYKWKYNENNVPYRKHHPNSVVFKEFKDEKQFSKVLNTACSLLVIALFIPIIIFESKYGSFMKLLWGIITFILSLPIYLLLNALFFKKDVYFYYTSGGSILIIGTGDMSKARFICMNLLSNILLGIIPYIIFWFFLN